MALCNGRPNRPNGAHILEILPCKLPNFVISSEMCYGPTKMSFRGLPPLSSPAARVDATTTDFKPR